MARRARLDMPDLFAKNRPRAAKKGSGVIAMPDPLELPIHKSILAYLRATLPPEFYIQHTPNGGILKGEVAKAKGMGMVSGWPDLAIYGWTVNPETGRRLRFVGFIEVKRRTGVTSEDQKEVHEGLENLRFPTVVCRSIEDAQAAVAMWGLPTLDVKAKGPSKP